MTSPLALSTDLLADCCLLFHLLLAFNIAYKNSKSQWITSRYRISKNIDWIVAFAVIPFDWIVFLSGLDPQSAVWCRLNKLLLIFSSIGPSKIIYSARGDSILDLHIFLAIILHITGCIYFYIGRKAADVEPNMSSGNVWSTNITWSYVKSYSDLETYDREAHFAMRPTSNFFERWMLCIYWVLSTISAEGSVDYLTPQNFFEMLFSIVLIILNLTIFLWIKAGTPIMLIRNTLRTHTRTHTHTHTHKNTHTHTHKNTNTHTHTHT
jgi:hypothetical protein